MSITTKPPRYRCITCGGGPVEAWRKQCSACESGIRRPYKKRRPTEAHIGNIDSPYEQAVLATEEKYGKPRAEWEHVTGHEYNEATLRLAKRTAGIRDQQVDQESAA